MSRRIMARFIPQAYINDYATDIDGAYEFDVTKQILAMSKEDALKIQDNSDEADNLWWVHPVDERHNGPFRIELERQIAAFFAVE